MIVVGCPVAWREWALPTWFSCLSDQTVQPDAFVFVHGGRPRDDTEQELRRAGDYFFHRTRPVQLVLQQDTAWPTERGSINKTDDKLSRYLVLANARNTMLALARLYFDADVFISLDSDVMLHDPRTIERLVELLEFGYDTASPLTYLHMREVESWGWNAGWWSHAAFAVPPPPQIAAQRQWVRKDKHSIRWGEVVDIDIPMAAIAMNRRVLADCRYAYHESGEDLAFAAALEQAGARNAWDTGLYARHVWEPGALDQPWKLPHHLRRERRYDE